MNPVTLLPWRALGGTRTLVAAYAEGHPHVSAFFSGHSSRHDDWKRTIERLSRPSNSRTAISDALLRQMARRGTAASARQQACGLRDTGTIAIVTGQQAGLFGGPLYTLLKAVTAIQLARWAEAQFGVPAVPVFWVEAEDHDWAEVRTTAVIDAAGELIRVAAEDPQGAGLQPVSTLAMSAGDSSLAQLRASLPHTEFSEYVLAELGRCYSPGRTFSTSFAMWMDTLLAGEGLVVFEADDTSCKPLVAHLFASELLDPSRSASLVRDQASRLRSAGHEPQIDPPADMVPLFYLDGAGRMPIRLHADALTVGGERHDPAALSAEALEHPERFSPNVILRPLVQDTLFPTACYVAGPSEFTYHAQLRSIYAAAGLPAPLLHPRVSGTLVDGATTRFLSRYDIPFESLRDTPEGLLGRLATRAIPQGVTESLHRAEAQLTGGLENLRNDLLALDPTLAGALDTTLLKAHDVLEGLHKKVVQAVKRKGDAVRRQASRAQTFVYPGGLPQERVLSPVCFLNRYGLSACQAMFGFDPLAMNHHQVLAL